VRSVELDTQCQVTGFTRGPRFGWGVETRPIRLVVGVVLALLAFLQVCATSELIGINTTWASPEESPGEATKRPKRVKNLPDVQLADPRGMPDLRICSQNLKLFGEYGVTVSRGPALSREEYQDKVLSLARRFASAQCDVVAVQELVGRNQDSLLEALKTLSAKTRELTNRVFEYRAGPMAEGGMALGYLVAKDRAEVLNVVSYSKVELPKLSPKQKPRLFSRSPLEIQLLVASKESGVKKTVTLVNFHFKSKRAGSGDPAGLEWETYRMEMSEALRRIVERRLSQTFASGESILVLLGDRNSNFDVASARILEGTLTLQSFQDTAPCRLSKRGAPICRSGESHPQRLFSVLTENPRTKSLPGTYEYKGEYSWLDDILMPAESLPFAWFEVASEAIYDSSVTYGSPEASDHAMVAVALNW
jgi:hypothetical protein